MIDATRSGRRRSARTVISVSLYSAFRMVRDLVSPLCYDWLGSLTHRAWVEALMSSIGDPVAPVRRGKPAPALKLNFLSHGTLETSFGSLWRPFVGVPRRAVHGVRVAGLARLPHVARDHRRVQPVAVSRPRHARPNESLIGHNTTIAEPLAAMECGLGPIPQIESRRSPQVNHPNNFADA